LKEKDKKEFNTEGAEEEARRNGGFGGGTEKREDPRKNPHPQKTRVGHPEEKPGEET
jgi:hypothetical protein